MSESIDITASSKEGRYSELLKGISALIEDEPDAIACMANIAAALKDTFAFWWVGFYRVVGNELVLGPFQGPLACTRIGYGRGVCGTAWKQRHTIIVPDVDTFPGHIACSSASRSEIVVPIFNGDDHVVAVLDIDSEQRAHFDHIDATFLQSLAALLATRF